jgi:hypothetical protein
MSFCIPSLHAEETLRVYTPEEMAEHKNRCCAQIQANPANHADPAYQMARAVRCISGDDSDFIPKVAGAGEIFFNESIPYQRMHNGIKIVLNSYYDCQWLTDVIYGLKGHHEPQEEKCFYEVLKYIPEGATMIELGAYWGYYSLWFAQAISDAQNYLIEPDLHRLTVGKKNFELNQKTASFFQAFAGVLRDREPDATGAQYVAIDDFMAQQKINHLALLHADIQGAEVEMLETTVAVLDRIDYFFISTHNTHEECMNFFKKHGLTLVAEHSHTQSCSGDGLIVAKRPGAPGPDSIAIRTY